jgi:predicted NAD/FAD-binding protein
MSIAMVDKWVGGGMRQRIAIIGGGVAGLTAGYLLNEKYDIRLYEKTGRIGGNAYTYQTKGGEDVDIAVAAYGKAGYPNFYKLLSRLKVKTKACITSYMSFHNLDTKTGVYMTPFRLLRGSKAGSILRLFRGVKKSRKMIDAGVFDDLTLEEGIKKVPQLTGDARIIFLSALCLLSSMSAEEVLGSPARFFFEKLRTHHDVVSFKAAWSVRAMKNKTKSYIEPLAAPYKDRIVLNSNIRTVHRTDKGVSLVFEDGERSEFDKVIFACNADQAFGLLNDPTDEEKRLLGVWKYKDGRMLLHSDHSSFPRRRLMQAYTFLYTDRDGKFNTSVNGALWHEPGVSSRCNLISSQHPNFPVDDKLVEFETVLRTPIFDFNSIKVIKELPLLNGVRNTYYCGSHFGFGLHEDAVRSAAEAAKHLGVDI